ncbi:MAG: hypothetical protein ACI4C7_08490 [Clostridia bacterium]
MKSNETEYTEFSAYSCVQYIEKIGYKISKNERKKFNSHINTIIKSKRYLRQIENDENITYFLGYRYVHHLRIIITV